MSKTSPSPLHIAGAAIQIAPIFVTSDEHDTQANRERAGRAEDDRRVAQHAPGGEEGAAGQASAEEALDASIAEARERASGPTAVPILLRDPVTGRIIGEE